LKNLVLSIKPSGRYETSTNKTLRFLILQGKILIADDQQVNLLLLERMLRCADYVSISSTTDSGEVCALHFQNCYDLILLDLQMPGMDRFQGWRRLRKLNRTATSRYWSSPPNRVKSCARSQSVTMK
jgi:PleD family two-component response regulator